MNWQIDDTRMPEFLRVTLDGEPSAEDYIQLWTEVLAHDRWSPGTAVLVDGTRRSPYGDRAAAVAKAVADLFARHADEFGDSPVASIVKTSEYSQFDRSVDYAARSRGSHSILRYFTNEKDAAEWLKHISRTRGYSA